MHGKTNAVINLTAKTKNGLSARRVTAHHGNTWMIRQGKTTSVVELHPTKLAIEDFEFGLTQEWWQIGYIYHRNSAEVALILDETGEKTSTGWYPVIGDNPLDVIKNRPHAEDMLVEEAAKVASYYVRADYPSHWQAVQLLQAVLDEHAEMIKGDKSLGIAPLTGDDLPTLAYAWQWDETVCPWAICWESSSPDGWAVRRDEQATDKRIGVYTEPYFSFVLGVYKP